MSTEDNTLTPETIIDQPFSSEVTPSSNNTSSKDGDVSPTQINETPIPKPIFAREVISESLNSQSRRILGQYEFGQLGALQIGKYVPGVSGDLRLTPDGMVLRDSDGNETVTLDGTTGSATFKGSVLAGSVITGSVQVGNSAILLDGANVRIVINDGTTNRIVIGEV